MRTSTFVGVVLATPSLCLGHGTVVDPPSRVYRVYKSNPERPNFALAANAVKIDGKQWYYTWNELSQNVPQAVKGGLKPGFDYSPWVPDGQLASGGRVSSTKFGRTYAGLDQVSAAWPSKPVVAGSTMTVDFLATAAHNPSVWDVWMTKPSWNAASKLTWKDMEFLGRPTVSFVSGHYQFQLKVPTDRSGHHVLWIAWQRNDPVGEVFFSTSDIEIRHAAKFASYGRGCAGSNALVPALSNATLPILGRSLDLRADLVAAKSFVSLLLGRRAHVDLGSSASGCTLLAIPDLLVPIGPWRGAKLTARIAIPHSTGLLGQRFGSQFLIVDPGITTRRLTIALSNGGEATIGGQ